jgi:carbamoyl-phosphate synthase small subunit
LRLFEPQEALLVLEDGFVFRGRSVVSGTRFGEVVFNTSMTGYQEILTDPSYCGQIIVMTAPHIGNYGVRAAVAESETPWAEGFVARRFTAAPSNFGSEEALPHYLRRQHVPAMDGIDTRAVVRRIREQGALRGVITSNRFDVDALVEEVRESPHMAGRALVGEVTRSHVTVVTPPPGVREAVHLAVYDFGVKANIVRSLASRGARVTVLPAHTPAAECLALDVDGIVLSNGPGDPEPLGSIIETVRELVESKRPIFGICLGHQLLGLAVGGRTFKLPFGHHGANQPVRSMATGKVWITSQNHGFAVDPDSLPDHCRVSHVNLNDGTVEGFVLEGYPVFSAQYHPEAAPGPHDAANLFDAFMASVHDRS